MAHGILFSLRPALLFATALLWAGLTPAAVRAGNVVIDNYAYTEGGQQKTKSSVGVPGVQLPGVAVDNNIVILVTQANKMNTDTVTARITPVGGQPINLSNNVQSVNGGWKITIRANTCTANTNYVFDITVTRGGLQ